MFVYILKCTDESYYTGIASDIERRLKQHLGLIKGGAKFTTRLRKVKCLVALWEDCSNEYARKLEYRLKKNLSHSDKKMLCENFDIKFSEFGIDIPQEKLLRLDVRKINEALKLDMS